MDITRDSSDDDAPVVEDAPVVVDAPVVERRRSARVKQEPNRFKANGKDQSEVGLWRLKDRKQYIEKVRRMKLESMKPDGVKLPDDA